MELKQYLLDIFHYNDYANLRVLEKIKLLPNPEEAIRLFSHLIHCQYKWMARVKHDPRAQGMSWWEPMYPLEELANKWADSLNLWLDYLTAHSDATLSTEVTFIGFDGGTFAAMPVDIALQLNYHSIHHRAQMQTMIRQQGLEPDFVDYIGTRYRKLS